LAQSQLPKHGHAPRKELIGGGTYLEVKEEIPWGPSRQFPMKGRSSRRKFPKGGTNLRWKSLWEELSQGRSSSREIFPKEYVPQGTPNNRSLGMSPKCVHALITVGVVQNVQCLLLRIDHLQLFMACSLSLVEAFFQENS